MQTVGDPATSSGPTKGNIKHRRSKDATELGTQRGHPSDPDHLLTIGEEGKLEGGDHVLRQAQKPVSTRSEDNPLELWFNKKRNNFTQERPLDPLKSRAEAIEKLI